MQYFVKSCLKYDKILIGGITMIVEMIRQYKYYRKEYVTNLKKENNKVQRIKMQIPNFLTRSRILAPFILVPCTIVGNFALATIIIALLGLTDCLDGFLARKWNATSNYGQKLDAISDKLFAIGIAIPICFTKFLSILISFVKYVLNFMNSEFDIVSSVVSSTFL